VQIGRQLHQLQRDDDEADREQDVEPAIRSASDGRTNDDEERADADEEWNVRPAICAGEGDERPAD
jgi:hypothetical protein